MKRFFSKKLLGIPMVLIAIILTTTMVLAVWGGINLTSTGQIQVTETPLTEEWSANTYVLDFGASNPVATGGSISVVSNSITITNIGTAQINGITVVVSGLPSAITNVNLDVVITGGSPLLPNGNATLVATLTGTAPGAARTIELSGITVSLTAN